MAAEIKKLFLEDCLDDSPQTRAMVDLFEKDAQMLKKFSKAFVSSCQKVLNAQVAMISATQEMSYYLRLYGMQNFPLDPSLAQNQDSNKSDTSSIATNLNQFANYVDEISTCFQVFVTQLNDSMVYPLNKFIDNEFDELSSSEKMYQISSEEDEMARQKYLKIPSRKEYEQQRLQVNEECFAFKKKFHESALNYFSSLNSLQFKRQYMFIEPMMSFVHTMKLFFKMGSETFSSDSSSKIDDFLNKISSHVCEVKLKQMENMEKTNNMIDLLQQDRSVYYAQRSDDHGNKNLKNSNIIQKSGYLNLRSKFPFISKWDRGFYFIQNGFLMHQLKSEIAGSAFFELKSDLVVSACEIDERQFTFQIISQFPKKTFYFQANNNQDRDEWIYILENAIKTDNKIKLESHMNNLKINNPSLLEQLAGKAGLNLLKKPEICFDLDLNRMEPNSESDLSHDQTFKVRFLGSMDVKSHKGNEYIAETIRKVIGTRAEQNIFSLNEFNMIINKKMVSLLKETPSDVENSSKLNNIDDLLCAKYKLDNIGYWASFPENDKLFGIIVKERAHVLKLSCQVFESDVSSKTICDAITKATQDAFKELVESNRSEHLKIIKQRENEILLSNIGKLPDKQDGDQIENENEEDINELKNVAELAFRSPNPNFIVLEKEILENVDDSNSNEKKPEADHDSQTNTESEA